MNKGPQKSTSSTRRDFNRRLVNSVALAGASCAAGAYFHNRNLIPEKEKPKDIKNFAVPGTHERMVVAEGEEGGKSVEAALAELGGIERFVKNGDRVLIKPNCAFDRPPHLGATSSPEVVGAVVRACRSAGAEVRVTDNPINNAEGCFVKSGLQKAIGEAGGEVWLPKLSMFASARVGELRIADWEVLYRPLQWADKIIGVPTVKSHNLSGASLSMKNWYGLLGGARNRLHQGIQEVIADLGLFITPTLVVMDGTRVLFKNGPTGGSPSDVRPGNMVAVGTDQVALDSWGVELLGLDPSAIPYLAKAEDLKVGRANYRELGFYREVRT